MQKIKLFFYEKIVIKLGMLRGAKIFNYLCEPFVIPFLK